MANARKLDSRILTPQNETLQLVKTGTLIDDVIHSSLFHEVYLKKDLPHEYPNYFCDNPQSAEFHVFYGRFKELCLESNPSVRQKWGHTETVEKWIGPIFQFLGWGAYRPRANSLIVENQQLRIRGSNGDDVTIRPSLIVGLERDALNHFAKCLKSEDTTSKVADFRFIPVATSYFNAWWDRGAQDRYDLEREELGRRNDSLHALGVDRQCQKYLDLVSQKWSIGTDGARWRLYSSTNRGNVGAQYLEFDLQIIADRIRTAAQTQSEDRELELLLSYFYWFFSKEGLFGKNIGLIDKIQEQSKVYLTSVRENLKDKFVYAMTIACNGLRDSFHRSEGKIKENRELIRDSAESLIFNILFIRSLECRRAITNHQDYQTVSLSHLVRKLRHFDPTVSWDENIGILSNSLRYISKGPLKANGTEIFNHVMDLHQILHNGSLGLGISGFKETVFTKEELTFLRKHKLTNDVLIFLLFELMYDRTISDRTDREVPFTQFSPEQLGSIYESFLEFQIEESETDLAFLKTGKTRQWKAASYGKYKNISTPVVRKGKLFFTPNNIDRKVTGSYYTPDYIVEYIVNETLRPLVENKTSGEILKIRVCDPAMGSGHFLNGALRFLTEEYLKKLNNEAALAQLPSEYEAKQEILHSCIYGVDINPRAVKLAKMSLWMESAHKGRKLERLDDQIVAGDSLTSINWKSTFPAVFKNNGFHAVLGNPPYASAPTMIDRDPLSRKRIEESGNFKTLKFKWDLYVAFIELSTNLVKKQGFIGLIVPFAVLSQKYAIEIRRHILEKCNLSKIVDLSNEKIFADAMVMTTILIFENGQNLTSQPKLRIGLSGKENELELNEVNKETYEIRLGNGKNVFALARNILAKGVPLEALCVVSKGCVPYSEKENKKKEHYIFEKKIAGYKPYIEAKDFEKYSIAPNRRWLNYDPNVISRTGLPELLSSPKVLVKLVIGKTGFSAGYDSKGCFTDHSVAGIGRKCDIGLVTSRSGIEFTSKDKLESEKITLEYVTILINSRLVLFLHKALWDSSLNLSINNLKLLPIVIPNSKQLAKIDTYFQTIAKNNDKSHVSRAIAKANELIYEIYNISTVEISFIESFLNRRPDA